MKAKRILILTYYWPPSGGGGVQRWMYFAMYLKRYGFAPTVITVHPDKASYPLIDASQLELVNDIDTIQTTTIEPLKFYSFLKSGNSKKEIPYGSLGENSGGMMSKVASFIRANFFIPDARKGWTKFAIKAAIGVLEKETFEWIITTGPPHSTHQAGMKLSQQFGVKWLADFRDPWSEIYYLKNAFRFNLARRYDEKLEKKVLKNAFCITTVGPGMADLLKKKLTNPSKLHILYNGYDSEMFEDIPDPIEKNKCFTISHFGLLGETQRFDRFVNSLKKASIMASKIKINLVGKVDKVHLHKLKSELPDIELNHTGFMPRKDALTLMKQSNLLLLCPPMIGETKLIISTKTMEYLSIGVPVLGIGDEMSDAAMLVKQQSISGFFEPENEESIARFISVSFLNWQLDKLDENTFDSKPYSRLSVTKELIEILKAKD